jgi:N-methylhydantoinase A
MIRLATDVGGTFTDLIGYDERTGHVYTSKCLTTVPDQSIGVMDAISLAAHEVDLPVEDVGFFVHGGTTVINAITERRGARTALLITAGFRDVLEIGRGNRPDLYNLQAGSPASFVPRYLRFEVRERLDARGAVVEPLVEADVAACAAACGKAGVEAIGVILLHSYANPGHEIRCADLLRAALPGVAVCASHEISRQWREYERANTVALNAFVQPVIKRYFASLQQALGDCGLTCPYYAMQSNGGIATFRQVVQSPLTLVESGPAGGVAGAVRVGATLGETDIIYLDVGGTTAKCTVIKDGQPTLQAEYYLERTRTFPGYPVQVPVVDIVEVGAGGGSIAWLDGGKLRVGPRSAGSLPGPACYDRGGVAPTVTDAKLVIGALQPASFGGGHLALNVALARKAVATLADDLERTVEDTASAIIKLAEENMISPLKLITIQRGHDPRDFVLIVSGGAGPMLAASLGRELNARYTVIPRHPGIFSAWGMLAAQPRVDLRRTLLARMDQPAMARVIDSFEALQSEAADYFGVADAGALNLTRIVEARYHRQEHSVSFPCPATDLDGFLNLFHDAHDRAFTFRLPQAPVEITAVHLQAEIIGPVLSMAKLPKVSHKTARIGTRPVYSTETGWQETPIYLRDNLTPLQTLPGPALIEEPTTTSLVLSGQVFSLDSTGQLIIRQASQDTPP